MLKQKKWSKAEILAREALTSAEAIRRQELIAEDCYRLAHSLVNQKRRSAEGLPYAQRSVEIYTHLRINPKWLKKAQETLTLCESLCD